MRCDTAAGASQHAAVPRLIEWGMMKSDEDWNAKRVGLELSETEHGTRVRFYHRKWAASNAHYRTSSFCWAMYPCVLRRHLETGESVPCDQRLDV